MSLFVDNRFPLSYYYRIADQTVKQAKIYRDEGNMLDFCLIVDRYSRLLSEIIPEHQGFLSYSSSEKLRHDEILQAFVREVKKLNPSNRRKDCGNGGRTPKRAEFEEDNLHGNSGRWEGDVLDFSNKIGKANHRTAPGVQAQKYHIPIKLMVSSFTKENTNFTYPFEVETRSSSAGSYPVAHASAKECKVNVHEVKHFFPSPALSCTESPPLVGQVSYMTIPESNHEYLESSCKDSSTSKFVQDVHISARLMDVFMELARTNTDNDLETCGILGAFLENRVFYITTLIVPKQESTSNSCQAINEEEIYAIQEARSLFTAGWIHTHPSQSCFLSSIDLHTQFPYQVMLPEAVAIVMAPTDLTRSYGIFRLTDPGGMTVLKNCQERGFHPHAEPADGSPIFESCSNVYINPNLRFEIIDLRT